MITDMKHSRSSFNPFVCVTLVTINKCFYFYSSIYQNNNINFLSSVGSFKIDKNDNKAMK